MWRILRWKLKIWSLVVRLFNKPIVVARQRDFAKNRKKKDGQVIPIVLNFDKMTLRQGDYFEM